MHCILVMFKVCFVVLKTYTPRRMTKYEYQLGYHSRGFRIPETNLPPPESFGNEFSSDKYETVKGPRLLFFRGDLDINKTKETSRYVVVQSQIVRTRWRQV